MYFESAFKYPGTKTYPDKYHSVRRLLEANNARKEREMKPLHDIVWLQKKEEGR